MRPTPGTPESRWWYERSGFKSLPVNAVPWETFKFYRWQDNQWWSLPFMGRTDAFHRATHAHIILNGDLIVKWKPWLRRSWRPRLPETTEFRDWTLAQLQTAKVAGT